MRSGDASPVHDVRARVALHWDGSYPLVTRNERGRLSTAGASQEVRTDQWPIRSLKTASPVRHASTSAPTKLSQRATRSTSSTPHFAMTAERASIRVPTSRSFPPDVVTASSVTGGRPVLRAAPPRISELRWRLGSRLCGDCCRYIQYGNATAGHSREKRRPQLGGTRLRGARCACGRRSGLLRSLCLDAGWVGAGVA